MPQLTGHHLVTSCWRMLINIIEQRDGQNHLTKIPLEELVVVLDALDTAEKERDAARAEIVKLTDKVLMQAKALAGGAVDTLEKVTLTRALGCFLHDDPIEWIQRLREECGTWAAEANGQKAERESAEDERDAMQAAIRQVLSDNENDPNAPHNISACLTKLQNSLPKPR